jgi:site-specific recombinase XerD
MSAVAELRAYGLTRADFARLNRELLKDKGYEAYPLGGDVAGYLRNKRKRLTDTSFRDYESTLDKFARWFTDLTLADLEPPVGTQRLEEFMDRQWGDGSPRAYNKHLSILRDFFKFQCLRGELHGDPTLAIERAKARGVYRTTFTPDQRRAIIASQESLRDRIALRLLLDYALRKGSLKAVQFKHFDHNRRRLTIFAKGGKVRNLPIPDQAFWHDLERLILDSQAQPHWFLLPTDRGNQHREVLVHEKPKGDHGLHAWWYRCLARAGVVEPGTSKGEHMHKARHSAGQRLLDHTGNLKAVQQLLGHASISTTGDTYVDWDEAQLSESLASLLERGES